MIWTYLEQSQSVEEYYEDYDMEQHSVGEHENEESGQGMYITEVKYWF